MKVLLRMLAVAAALAAGVAAAADAPGSYATDLGRVYGGYQRLLALKEACETRAPDLRAATDKAFAAWHAQHRALLQDLQRRVDAMIRAASKDKDEYVRNIGQYEGAILLERKGYRDLLLALGAEDLRGQCQRVPEMLKGPEADFSRVYAAELETIRQRK